MSLASVAGRFIVWCVVAICGWVFQSYRPIFIISLHLIGRRAAMRFLILLCVTTAALGHGLYSEWRSWKERHGRVYADDGEERARRSAWQENYRLVEEHNRNTSHGFTLALNQFADLVSGALYSISQRCLLLLCVYTCISALVLKSDLEPLCYADYLCFFQHATLPHRLMKNSNCATSLRSQTHGKTLSTERSSV